MNVKRWVSLAICVLHKHSSDLDFRQLYINILEMRDGLKYLFSQVLNISEGFCLKVLNV
jgi:hypothetical protein